MSLRGRGVAAGCEPAAAAAGVELASDVATGLPACQLAADALRQVLAQKKLMTVDELRRGIESIPEAEYFALGYYERWLRSIAGLMIEKGIVDKDILS